MEMLLRSSTDANNPSKISAIKSTDVATIATIIRDSSADAKAAKAASGTNIPTSRPSSPGPMRWTPPTAPTR